METLNRNELLEQLYTLWDKLKEKANEINEKHTRARLIPLHVEHFDSEKKIWDDTLKIFAIHIQAYSLASQFNQNGFLMIGPVGCLIAYMKSLEKAFEKNGALAVNDNLYLEMMNMEGNSIPLVVLTDFLENEIYDQSNDNDIKPVNEIFPNKPDETYLNSMKFILITTKYWTQREASSLTKKMRVALEFHKSFERPFEKQNANGKQSRLQKLLEKHKSKEKELER